jgi:O-antigen/teichoic acid export membrane protein
MKTTFIQRLWKGLASSAMAQVVGMLNGIMLVPLFLHAWGAEQYGRWLALTAMASYLSLLDLGGQSYIGNLLAIEYVKQNHAEFRKILSTGVSLFIFIGLAVLVLVSVLIAWPGLPFAGLNRPLNLEERLVILFTSALLLIAIPGGVYVTAYRATGLFARGTMVGNIMRTIGLGLSAGLLYFNVRPDVYAAAMLGHGIVMSLVVVWDIRRQIPTCREVYIGLAAARDGLRYLGGSFYFWLMAIAGAVNQQGVLLVLTTASPAVVALFSTHRAVAGLLRYVGAVLQGPLWPEFSFLWGANRRADIERLIVMSTGLAMMCSGAVAAALYIFFPHVYPLWTGRKLDVDMPLLTVLLLQGVLAAGWFTASWGLMAANQHRQLAIWTLLNALVTIVAAVLFVGRWGAVGVAFASLLGDIACSLWVIPWLAARFMQISVRRIYMTMLFAMVASILLAVLAVVLSTRFAGWLSLLIFALAVLGLSYPALMFVLGRQEAEYLVGRARRFIQSLIRTMLRVPMQP